MTSTVQPAITQLINRFFCTDDRPTQDRIIRDIGPLLQEKQVAGRRLSKQEQDLLTEYDNLAGSWRSVWSEVWTSERAYVLWVVAGLEGVMGWLVMPLWWWLWSPDLERDGDLIATGHLGLVCFLLTMLSIVLLCVQRLSGARAIGAFLVLTMPSKLASCFGIAYMVITLACVVLHMLFFGTAG